ncbi:transposase [Lactiplantibacillus plantarum]|nr:transposase [Lactiplantibacillus plantarum]
MHPALNYGYGHWQPSQTVVKRRLLAIWIKYPMSGYARLPLILNQNTNLRVGQKLVYQLMQELGIKSRMIKKTNKPIRTISNAPI